MLSDIAKCYAICMSWHLAGNIYTSLFIRHLIEGIQKNKKIHKQHWTTHTKKQSKTHTHTERLSSIRVGWCKCVLRDVAGVWCPWCQALSSWQQVEIASCQRSDRGHSPPYTISPSSEVQSSLSVSSACIVLKLLFLVSSFFHFSSFLGIFVPDCLNAFFMHLWIVYRIFRTYRLLSS